MKKKEPDRLVVLENLVDKYGLMQVRWLVKRLTLGHSGEGIAEEFGVTRERVRQWKNSIGSSAQVYQVHPDVQKVLKESTRAGEPK